MAKEMRIIDMHLEYGVHPARSTALGTSVRFGPTSSSEYDSGDPVQSVEAQAEAIGNLIVRFCGKAIDPMLQDRFFVELDLHLKTFRGGSHR
jgi:hypothetical protein